MLEQDAALEGSAELASTDGDAVMRGEDAAGSEGSDGPDGGGSDHGAGKGSGGSGDHGPGEGSGGSGDGGGEGPDVNVSAGHGDVGVVHARGGLAEKEGEGGGETGPQERRRGEGEGAEGAGRQKDLRVGFRLRHSESGGHEGENYDRGFHVVGLLL